MSFEKAADLLRLARMCAAARQGITYQQVTEEFGISERTAKRMIAVLESLFEVERLEDDDRRARFRVPGPLPFALPERPETALEALELALRPLDPASDHARALRDLRDGVLARLDRDKARRAEAEADIFLQAYGHVASPGPRTRKDPAILAEIGAALRGPHVLSVRYGEDGAPRLLEPHGILQGVRDYLIARQPGKGDVMAKFRLDRIREARALPESFALDPGFAIDDYAAEGFGVWNDPEELAEVIWRFAPEAAERAAEFRFHPRQQTERAPDGALIVRFTASGWTEMAWHLYQWGDKVEVLAPEGLRAMVAGHRRTDFTALP